MKRPKPARDVNPANIVAQVLGNLNDISIRALDAFDQLPEGPVSTVQFTSLLTTWAHALNGISTTLLAEQQRAANLLTLAARFDPESRAAQEYVGEAMSIISPRFA